MNHQPKIEALIAAAYKSNPTKNNAEIEVLEITGVERRIAGTVDYEFIFKVKDSNIKCKGWFGYYNNAKVILDYGPVYVGNYEEVFFNRPVRA